MNPKMKQSMSTRLLTAGLLLATLFLHGCEDSKKKKPEEKTIKGATIITDFERNPPIANNIR
jgi:hypothetical protein